MISTHTIDLAHARRISSLVNVGQTIEDALVKKRQLLVLTYEVHNTLYDISELFSMTGCVDVDGYVAAMKHVHSDYRKQRLYQFKTTGTISQEVDHKTMLSLVHPRGLMTYCATVTEALHLVGQFRGKIRRLLLNGHRIVIVGDIGRAPATHIGVVTLKKKKICFRREKVTGQTVYKPTDLFLTRVIH